MASAGSAPVTLDNREAVVQAATLARVHVSARWFYWIAGLSLVNSAVVIFGGQFHFVVGLGVTSVVDGVAKQLGSAGVVLDLVINSVVAGVFCLFGYCASKAQKWAFVVGMALYALDGLLLLMAQDYLSVAFHAYALYCIYRGLAAAQAAAQA